MIKQLVRLANHLDKKGLTKEADYLDAVIKKHAKPDIPTHVYEGGDAGGEMPEHLQEVQNTLQESRSGRETSLRKYNIGKGWMPEHIEDALNKANVSVSDYAVYQTQRIMPNDTPKKLGKLFCSTYSCGETCKRAGPPMNVLKIANTIEESSAPHFWDAAQRPTYTPKEQKRDQAAPDDFYGSQISQKHQREQFKMMEESPGDWRDNSWFNKGGASGVYFLGNIKTVESYNNDDQLVNFIADLSGIKKDKDIMGIMDD